MSLKMLEDDDPLLVQELERKNVPFVKFTGHTSFLNNCTRDTIMEKRCTVRRFFQKAFLQHSTAIDDQPTQAETVRKMKEFAELKAKEYENRIAKEVAEQTRELEAR